MSFYVQLHTQHGCRLVISNMAPATLFSLCGTWQEAHSTQQGPGTVLSTRCAQNTTRNSCLPSLFLPLYFFSISANATALHSLLQANSLGASLHPSFLHSPHLQQMCWPAPVPSTLMFPCTLTQCQPPRNTCGLLPKDFLREYAQLTCRAWQKCQGIS